MNFFSKLKYTYDLFKSDRELNDLATELSSFHDCRVSFRKGKVNFDSNGDIDFDISDDFGKDFDRDFNRSHYLSGGSIRSSSFGLGDSYDFHIFHPGDASGSYGSFSLVIHALSLTKVYVSEDEFGNPVFTIDLDEDKDDYQLVVYPNEDYVQW